MNGRRPWILLLLLAAAAVSACAETFAVSVRSGRSVGAPASQAGVPVELAAELAEILADVEEGTMDVMFGNGHVVFDTDHQEATETSWYDALAAARAGGANLLVLVDVDYEELPGKRVRPFAATVTVANVFTAQDHLVGRIDVTDLAGDGRTPKALAIALGNRAAESALKEILEGKTPW